MGSHQKVFCVPCANSVSVEDKFSVCGSEVYRLRYSEVELFYPIGLATPGWLNLPGGSTMVHPSSQTFEEQRNCLLQPFTLECQNMKG